MAEVPSGHRGATLRLDLLGGFSARDGSDREIPLRSRKAQALLAVLALAPGRSQAREKLTGLLWSDRGETQARSSLRQALAELRKRLPDRDPPLLRADRESVGVDSDTVEVDVLTFESLLEEGTPAALAAAAALYRGDFLEGIGVHDPAFEDWLGDRRRRLRERACEALSKLLDHQAADDGERAIATARRLVALDPLREASHRALMKLHADRGERTQALKQYQLCRDVLQADLGVSPEPETERLADEIRAGATDTKGAGDPAPDRRTSGPEASPPPPDKPSIAVLPFSNLSGDAEQDYFADGLTEDIITELSRFREFDVFARNSTFQFKGRAVPIPEVGRELGAQYVVEGSVRKAGGRVRVTAQLINAATNTHIWADRYDRQLDDIFAIQDEMTGAVAARVADRLKGAGAELSRTRPKQSITAYDLVLQSRPYRTDFTPESASEAARLLREAIALDSNCAQAYAGLAFVLSGDYEEDWSSEPEASLREATAAAKRAVAIDFSDGYAHASLAYVLHLTHDFEQAAHEAETALSLNPNHANILMTCGWIAIVLGDLETAIRHIQRAWQPNPYMPGIHLCTLGVAYFQARRYQEAIDVISQVADPPIWSYLELSACHAYLGEDAMARRYLDRYLERARREFVHFPGEDAEGWRVHMKRTVIRRRDEDVEHYLEGARRAGLPL